MGNVLKLKQLIAKYPKASMPKLGEMLGLTRQGVHQIIRKHNLEYIDKRTGYFDIVLPEKIFKEAIKNKILKKDFLKKYNISLYLLNRYLDIYDLTWLYNRNIKVDINKLKILIKEYPGMTIKEISVYFDVSINTIRQYIYNHKLKRKE